ncbi:hypothetical protein BO99DRAFT_90574 [Aspergillus violaceofuscus CBS 115571]|uniref:Uncharacterized protein n=1 Tax=Aspergillus violaceofuscus (strain CBS 115571) TaxID=1450538 RepID=A0A2V5HIN7_ASPV1|nr:hypothetical protein BO99DRAFT_90574 [Aspergillus violaceofuscus CBS 115571]
MPAPFLCFINLIHQCDTVAIIVINQFLIINRPGSVASRSRIKLQGVQRGEAVSRPISIQARRHLEGSMYCMYVRRLRYCCLFGASVCCWVIDCEPISVRIINEQSMERPLCTFHANR